MSKTALPLPGHWHILGAGAMGCLWGAYLAEAGRPITLLLRDYSAHQIFSGHIQLHRNGQQHEFPVKAATVADQGPPIDYLLVTVKAQDTLAALESIHHRLHEASILVLMQNGMGIVEQISPAFPALNIILGTSTHGAYRIAPFQVVHAGVGETWLGPGTALITKNQVMHDLGAWGAQWDDDILTRLWDKLAVNCAINPLTALLQCKNGDLLQLPNKHDLLKRICDETAEVMHGLGLKRTPKALFETVCRVATATAENYSSMCQDIRHHRSTEIAYLNGYLLKQAERLGLDLPCNRMLVELIDLKQNLVSD